MRAIRLDLFARRELPTEEIIAYIRRMAARTTPRGWHLQFYTPGTVVRDLLPFLAELEDVFVIDHMGYMLESEGLTRADFERLLDVLERGFCHIKLSGPYRIAKGKPLASVEWLGRALVETRPDRLLWGSDWPHLPDGQRDTGELLNLLADWAPDEAVQTPDPRGHAAAAVLFVILSAVYSLKTFRIVALTEATSFLLLLVASVLKRTADADVLVTILGPDPRRPVHRLRPDRARRRARSRAGTCAPRCSSCSAPCCRSAATSSIAGWRAGSLRRWCRRVRRR